MWLSVLDAAALTPFVDSLLRNAEAFRQNRHKLRTRLYQGPYLGRRRGLLAKMN